MACLLIAIGLMVGGTILIVAVAFVSGSRGVYSSSFREVARQLRGRFQAPTMLGYPQVDFRHGSTIGSMSVERYDGGPTLRIVVGDRGGAWDWELVPYDRRSDRGTRGIEVTGSELRIPERHRVRARDVEAFRRAFHEGARWQVERLLQIRNDLPTCIIRDGDRLVVRKLGLPADWRELLELIRVACDLYDQVRLVGDEAIEFVDGVEAALLDEVICPICGDPIGHDLVYCGSCKTPHHRECWEYNGRCATFACGQERYRIPEVARRPDEVDRRESDGRDNDAARSVHSADASAGQSASSNDKVDANDAGSNVNP